MAWEAIRGAVQRTARFFSDARRYMEAEKEAIARANLNMLKPMTLVFAGALSGYLACACSLGTSAGQIYATLAAACAQLLLSAAVWRYARRLTIRPATVTLFCFACAVTTDALAIYSSVFVFRSDTAVLFPVMLICMSQFFTLRVRDITLLVSLSGAVFLLLAFLFKPTDVALWDLVNTLFAASAALVSHYTITYYKTASHKRQCDLDKLCKMDPMTGLYNKDAFAYLYDRYVQEMIAYRPYALLVLDIDDFKFINDRYGHEFGDRFLLALTEEINLFLAKAGPDNIGGRFGGDEFLLLLKDVENREALSEQVRRFRAALNRDIGGVLNIQSSCSIGAALSTQAREGYAEMFKRADGALYEVKRAGKDGYGISMGGEAE